MEINPFKYATDNNRDKKSSVTLNEFILQNFEK